MREMVTVFWRSVFCSTGIFEATAGGPVSQIENAVLRRRREAVRQRNREEER